MDADAAALAAIDVRIEIVEGLLRALDSFDRIGPLIDQAADRREASVLLQSQPFGYSEIVAEHILDLTLSRRTRLGRSELHRERTQLVLQRAALGKKSDNAE